MQERGDTPTVFTSPELMEAYRRCLQSHFEKEAEAQGSWTSPQDLAGALEDVERCLDYKPDYEYPIDYPLDHEIRISKRGLRAWPPFRRAQP